MIRAWRAPLFGALMMTMMFALAGCPSDELPSSSTPCSFDEDCPLGTVCLKSDGQCGNAGCEFCLDNQICYTLEDGTQSCSRPECNSDNDCTSPEVCSGGLCQESTCATRDDCPAGKVCSLASTCVDPPEMCQSKEDCPSGEVCLPNGLCRAGCGDDTECAADQYCASETQSCVTGCRDSASCTNGDICDMEDRQCKPMMTITSCDMVTCPDGERCDPNDNFECKPVCTSEAGMPNSCADGQICNESTGQCITGNCPKDPATECAGNAAAPYLNQELCECVACLDNSQCSGGATCNANGQCAMCAQACDQNNPAAACGNSTPYCISDCCVECAVAADCPQGTLCLDGTCAQAPDCSVDPTACPDGLECREGNCVPMGAGMSCNQADPNSCPMGQFCIGGSCQGQGGGPGFPGLPGGDCGLCGTGCMCNGNLTCNADPLFMLQACTGCNSDADCGGTTTCDTSFLVTLAYGGVSGVCLF